MKYVKLVPQEAIGAGGGIPEVGTPQPSLRLHMTSTLTNLPAVEQIADAITKKLLGVREHYLPSHDGGGTEAPACKATAQKRRELKSGKNKAIQTILAIAFADAEDSRIPTECVASALDEIAEAVRARARAIRREPVGAPSILPVLKRAQMEHQDFTVASLDVASEPLSMEKLDELEREVIEGTQALQHVRGAVRARRSAMRLPSARHGHASVSA